MLVDPHRSSFFFAHCTDVLLFTVPVQLSLGMCQCHYTLFHWNAQGTPSTTKLPCVYLTPLENDFPERFSDTSDTNAPHLLDEKLTESVAEANKVNLPLNWGEPTALHALYGNTILLRYDTMLLITIYTTISSASHGRMVYKYISLANSL